MTSILKIVKEGKTKSLSNYLESRGIRVKTKSHPNKKIENSSEKNL